MNCSVCHHPERQAIDQALLGGATLAAVSKQHHLSTSALDRHKGHLRTRVNRARTKLQHNFQQHCFFWLSRALEAIDEVIKTAQAEGNINVIFRAVRQGTSIINFLHKQDFQLEDSVVYQVLTSPQWNAQASFLPDDPGIMAHYRQSLTHIFSASCSELEALLSASTPGLGSASGRLESFQSGQPQGDPSHTATGQRPTANGLFLKREKSGKLPGKSGFGKNKINKNQQLALSKKIIADHSDCACSRNWLDDLAAGRLDLDTLNAFGTGRPLPEIFPEFLAAATPGKADQVPAGLAH